MRILLSFSNSATNPLYLSLITDYIPPNKRCTANGFLNAATYIGIALSSISIISI
jgi:MFS family permease